MNVFKDGWRVIGVGLALAAGGLAAEAGQIEVRVRPTAGGPRIFVDGKAVRPRFYYGSPTCLAAISESHKTTFTLPFRAVADTDRACVTLAGSPGDEPFWFSHQTLVDLTDGVTNALSGAEEVRRLVLTADNLKLKRGHLYRFVVTNRAVHDRQFFTHRVTQPDADGQVVELPLPYGDTLCETTALAAEAEVDFVTFSTGNSYGCDPCWKAPGEPDDFSAIDTLCERLVRANPNVLLVPRVNADAPKWMLERDPSLKMKFARGFTLDAPSLSARPYREAACAHFEKLVRHLSARFPRNFAGIHVSGQNSAEWFYHLSQSREFSGYDVHTRDAFRAYLAKLGEPDAAVAEVPSAEERARALPDCRRDPVRDRRLLQFARFRQEEVASFLSELGAAVRRGSDGKCLALFFYGYAWELAGVWAGPSETGHYALEWLLRNGRENVDGLSAPFSYTNRKWPGSVPVMSAAETISRAGILWINEDDTRTYKEDIWCYKAIAGGRHETLEETRDILVRNACVGILRGYGDWWMDLFGRGWYRSHELWEIRKGLNRLDDAMLRRTKPYSPEIAVVFDEASFLAYGCGAGRHLGPLANRRTLDVCGAPYGQYYLNDILERPIDAKLYYLNVASGLTEEQQARLAAYKAAHPKAVFVENVTAKELTAEAIAANAVRAGVHVYVKPGAANVNAAEGHVVVSAMEAGELTIDFGVGGEIADALTGKALGNGPKLTLPFRKGETRVFVCRGRSYSVSILGDTHFDTAPSSVYHGKWKPRHQNDWRDRQNEFRRNADMWADRMPRLIAAAAKTRRTDTAYLFQMGDLVQGDCSDFDTQVGMFRDAQAACSKGFGDLPFLTVCGNHDSRGGGGKAFDAYVLAEASKALGRSIDNTNFVLRHGPDAFVFVDFMRPDAARLNRMLDETADARYLFLVVHSPIAASDTWGPYWFLLGKPEDTDARRALFARLLKRRAIVLCGHLHYTQIRRWRRDDGEIVEFCANSVWRPQENRPALVASSPAQYGAYAKAHPTPMDEDHDGCLQKRTQDEILALMDEYRPGLVEYRKYRAAGHFLLRVSDAGVAVDFYACDALTPTETFKLR